MPISPKFQSRVKKIFFDYIGVRSYSNSRSEESAVTFLHNLFSNVDYFKDHGNLFGAFKIPDDSLGRSVFWAMKKGEGNETVVLLHHYDVVGVEDYGDLKKYAFKPDKLLTALKSQSNDFADEIRYDLENSEFIFGRGTADMKAGGAIHVALIQSYSSMTDLKGNILLLAVPDEENLSSGAMGSIFLLDELKKKFNLEYKLVINSEPQHRSAQNSGTFYGGSVGKTLVFVYARGILSHAGSVVQGLNPISVVSEIVTRTEANVDLSEFIEGDVTAPPTWLYFRDNKVAYDVSTPLGAYGFISFLNMKRRPAEILELMRDISESSFNEAITRLRKSLTAYTKSNGGIKPNISWKPEILLYSSLVNRLKEKDDNAYRIYQERRKDTLEKIRNRKMTVQQASIVLTEQLLDLMQVKEPVIVIGLSPPYYPGVSNSESQDGKLLTEDLKKSLVRYAKDELGMDYEFREYYPNISDLSYFSYFNFDPAIESIKDNMPLYGKSYSVPFEAMVRNSMAGINIGPWGKDFHKFSERVFAEDLYRNIPELVDLAIRRTLRW